MAFFELFDQFMRSMLAAWLFVGICQLARFVFSQAPSRLSGWITLAGLAFLMVYPCGWDWASGFMENAWVAMCRVYQHSASQLTLFLADAAGAALGGLVAYLMSRYVMAAPAPLKPAG
ncbi:hypothetical protein C1Y35_16660 [Pseudomonas sp. GW456-L14]|nr:hypothetical protein C1Y35_16660 [Pseudomonas sp. GW456-L14]PMY57813.1 hypothetical protein C1Y34_07595 [Pseudomonas sp. GW456-L12]